MQSEVFHFYILIVSAVTYSASAQNTGRIVRLQLVSCNRLIPSYCLMYMFFY